MTSTLSNPLAEFACVSENEPLAPRTWYKVGGPARYFVRPDSIETLRRVVSRCVQAEIPIYVLGLGANLLVADEGVDGAVFRFDHPFWKELRREGDGLVVGAGHDIQKLVLQSAKLGLAGLECMAGIPGTVGGAIRMNAGGKFGDLGSRVLEVTVMDSGSTVFTRTRDDLLFDYRRTNITAPFILQTRLELSGDDPERISSRVKEIWMYKKNTQPLNTKNAGCMFKNPRGLSAGALIDRAGLKGHVVGRAQVSDVHANFIVARPGCTAAEILALRDAIIQRVREYHGVTLESEVQTWPYGWGRVGP